MTDFSYFLYGCKSLEELDLSGISTRSAKNGYGMFSGMTSLATVRLGAGFSWVGGAYLPADVPCGIEDTYSALPPATTAISEKTVEPEKGQATGEGEEKGAGGAQKSMKEEAR